MKKLEGAGWALALFLAMWLAIGWMVASGQCVPNPASASWPVTTRCTLLKFFYDWQNVLAGFFAIFAACIGAFVINRQIRQADEQERERIRSRHSAARAMLPLALSSLVEYTQECADRLRALYDRRKGETIPENELPLFKPPNVPTSAVVDLRAMIESSGSHEGRALAIVLSRVQVQASRLRSLTQKQSPASVTVVTASQVEQYIVDTAEIFARASSWFGFARGDDEQPPFGEPTIETMFNAQQGLSLFDFDRVRERIERQYGDKSNDPSSDGMEF